MDRRAQITATPLHVPSILVVLDPAWPALFSLCLAVAPGCGVLLHRCEIATVATIAAERRPLAIIMSNGVYAKDPVEFEALARDVRSTLLRLDEEVSERELEAMLSGALRETSASRDASRRDEGSGRYTLIGAQRSEAVGPRGGASADPRSASRAVAPSAEPRLAQRRGEVSSPQSTLPPPSSRAASPPSVRAPLMSRSFTPVPSSVAPPSFRAPPSTRAVPPSARGQASPYAAPGVPRSVPPPPSRPASYLASTQAGASGGPMSSPPPSMRGAPLAGSAGMMSGPPPSSRAPTMAPPSTRAPTMAPPSTRAPTMAPPSTRAAGGPPPSTRAAGGPPPSRRFTPPPPSTRAAGGPPPSRRFTPPPPSSSRAPSASTLPSPPSVRATQLGALPGTEPPPSIRPMPPLSARMGPPSSARPELSPRSGVRECGSEELDAVFEDQKLPFDALSRGSRGTTPR
ncbi:hypothetical protein [Sorangium cellulosum]|uniref:hypothetical protein n=1 Tax=Sorangium cellulosum TaxID=56 RepID=UPI000CF43B39|nr:hypothetical protein [Sorangium cellulosum]